MHELEIAGAGVLRLALREEINRSEQSRYHHRLHGLLMVGSGQSCNPVATLFAPAATTLQRWVRRFEGDPASPACAMSSLPDGPARRICVDGRAQVGVRARAHHRPGALDMRRWQRIEADLRRVPAKLGLQANLWDGPVLSERLRRSSGVTLGIRRCQRMSRQMGFRPRKPPPRVVPSAPQAEAAAVSGASSVHASGRVNRPSWAGRRRTHTAPAGAAPARPGA